jgi:hypothetical protein
MKKAKTKCNVVLVYNIHNKPTQWQFISDILPVMKQKGYNKLVLEVSYKDTFQEFKEIAGLLARLPVKDRAAVLDQVKGTIKPELDVKEINSVVNINSPHFKTVLKIANDKASSNPGKEQYIEIEDKKLIFPISMESIKALNTQNQNKIVEALKDLAVKIIQNDSNHHPEIFMAANVNAILNGFKVSGMDVANDQECKQADIDCRNAFMAQKLNDYCFKTKGDIVASVGLSHLALGQILKENEQIKLKEYYPIDYKHSDSEDHAYLLSSQNKQVTILDIREPNVIKTMLVDMQTVDVKAEL